MSVTLEGAIGKVLIIAGVIVFIIGTLFIGINPFDQSVCVFGWFSGVMILVVGFVVEFELFKDSTKIGRLAISLMVLAATFLITALIFFSIAELQITTTTTEITLRGVPVPNVFVKKIHPFGWLLVPLAEVGIILFVSGFLLKLYDEVF